jgi:hypothetical protein
LRPGTTPDPTAHSATEAAAITGCGWLVSGVSRLAGMLDDHLPDGCHGIQADGRATAMAAAR